MNVPHPPKIPDPRAAARTFPFLVFLGLLGLGALEVILPLLRPLVWGGVAAFLTHPLFAFLMRRTGGRHPGLCATVTLGAALLFVLAPVSYLVTFLGQETTSLVSGMARFNAQLQAGSPERIATANIGCQLHLEAGARQPVLHWLELLDPAPGN